MSKTSAKARLIQLKEWLEWRKVTTAKKERKPKFSKADHYKNVQQYHGSKNSN